MTYTQHRDTQETLAVLDRLDLDTEKPSDEEIARKFGMEDDYLNGTLSCWQKLKPKLWSLADEPYSSNAAKVNRYLNGFVFFTHSIQHSTRGQLFILFLVLFFHFLYIILFECLFERSIDKNRVFTTYQNIIIEILS